jgi:AraC family transcriptional regulator
MLTGRTPPAHSSEKPQLAALPAAAVLGHHFPMPAATLLKEGPLRVFDYRCSAGPDDRPFTEQHGSYSISYVRRGSFGYRTRGRSFELVAGAFLLGRPGDDFMCTHQHHAAGDECLSYHFGEEWFDLLGLRGERWMSGALPVIAALALLGERAQAAADGLSDVALDEAGALLAAHLLAAQGAQTLTGARIGARERRRAVRIALWLEAHAAERLHLARVARESGVSAFHFLRTFTQVTGVTPHQFLVRARLRHAARLLARDCHSIADIAYEVGFGDLSNFVRTFHRAAGMSPRDFRRRTQHRKIFQEPLAAAL